MTLTPEKAMSLFHTEGLNLHERDDLRSGLFILKNSDPVFLPLVKRMLTTGSELARDVTERALAEMLTGTDKGSARSRLEISFSANHTNNSNIIENVFLEWCVLNFVDESNYAFDVEDLMYLVESGDHYCATHSPNSRPAPPYKSVEAGQRYYSALATVCQVIDPHEYIDKFIEEAPAFLTWALKQDDLNSALNSALRFNTVNPKVIEDGIAMLEETTPPLHGGLL